MIHAYDEIYLDDAMKNLGEAFDYAVNYCHLDLSAFLQMFITSGYASSYEKGVPKIISGLSGTELVYDILVKSMNQREFPDFEIEYHYSKEYWCGWILAYYQWYCGRSFKDICKYLPAEQLEKMYPALHTASENRFIDAAESIFKRSQCTTKLQTLRRLSGYSQRILSEKSGVNIRNIQQYEQRAKDINQAAVSTLLSLSRVLGCQIEDLIE